MQKLYLSLLLCLFAACDSTPVQPDDTLPTTPYFPPKNTMEWEYLGPDRLGWDFTKVEALRVFLEDNNTRAFIMLKNGRVVMEEYWGKNVSGSGGFGPESQWYWASAGKTLTAFLVGKAQEKGFLDINDRSADYLGQGWTSLNKEQEDKVQIRHQLTMSTGLEYNVPNLDCTDDTCLTFRAEPGTQWFYHNAPYTLLQEVVSNASGISFDQFTNEELKQKIGMEGRWLKSGYNNVYWSRPRDMARFGILILNKGKWDGTQVMSDSVYFDEMVNSSQELNPSYGYLWWLNGKGEAVFPTLPTKFQTSVAPQAPADLFAAMGKNGQFLDIVPSEELIVVRMGEAPDASLVPIQFHDDMWGLISEMMEN